MSALGFYQVNPSNGIFVFGSPLFDKATIRLPHSKTFSVIAENNNDKNVYIQSAMLNGNAYEKSYITYQDIMNGGTLKFIMREIDFWRRNMLYFRSATLESISKTLERTYGITIKFESKELKNITFSGSIRNNSLANVFHIISLTYPLSYKTNKDTVIISKE